jgi:hypothetical protein
LQDENPNVSHHEKEKTNLHGELVASMRSTVDHVKSRDWDDELLVASQVSNVLNRPTRCQKSDTMYEHFSAQEIKTIF